MEGPSWGYLLLVVLFSGCVGPSGTTLGPGPAEAPAGAQYNDHFLLSGTGCFEVAVLVEVPAESARRFVPEEFSVRGEAVGRAFVLAGFVQCDGAIDGDAIPAYTTGEIAVNFEPPGGGDPLASLLGANYVDWWPTDSDPVQQALRHIGREPAHAKSGGFDDASTAPGIRTVSTSGTLPEFSFHLSATVPDEMGVLPEHESILWVKTQAGYANALFHVDQGELSIGTGTVRTDAGSPLADLLGSASATGVGLVAAFDYSGPVRATSSPP